MSLNGTCTVSFLIIVSKEFINVWKLGYWMAGVYILIIKIIQSWIIFALKPMVSWGASMTWETPYCDFTEQVVVQKISWPW